MTPDPIGDGLLIAAVVLAFATAMFVLDAVRWLVVDLLTEPTRLVVRVTAGEEIVELTLAEDTK